MNNKFFVSFSNDQSFGDVARSDKFTDSRFVQVCNTTGAVVQWTPPPQGTASYQRTGDTISLTKLDLNSFFVYGDAVGNIVRFAVIQTRGNFVPANVGQLFGTGATGSIDTTSPWLQYIVGRQCKVLCDYNITLQPGGDSAITIIKRKLPIKVKEIEFDQGTTTAKDGAIFFVFLSDSSLVPSPSANIMLRASFVDA